MGFRPRNREMLAVQVVVVAASSAFAYVLWTHGHGRLALALATFAGVIIAGGILTAIDDATERH